MSDTSVVPFQGDQSDWFWDGQNWQPCQCGGGPPSPPQNWPPNTPPAWWSGPVPPWYPGANAGIAFGTTAPPNPIRGHFWWNGKCLHLFDGAGWLDVVATVIGGGGGGVGGGGGGGGGTTITGGVVVSVTAPTTPVVGMLWWNGTLMQLWNGTLWVVIAEGQGTGGGGGGGGGSTVAGVIISTTTPSNPTAGLQWWNGSLMRVFDGTTWQVIGPGTTTGPVPTTTRVFSLTQASPIASIPANTWTIVPYTASPPIDTELGWDLTTRRFTPTKAGIYFFTVRWTVGEVALVKNDTGTFSGNEMWVGISTGAGTAATAWQSAIGMTLLNGSTDYVRVFANPLTAAYTFPGNAAIPLIEAWLMP